MLILADGEDVRDLVPDDDRIRLVHLADTMPIGQKRNTGCERAAGDIIAHWDDDDWSGPGRIENQVFTLTENGKAVTGYRTMLFTDGSSWWFYDGTPLFALGTSLCYKRSWWQAHPFSGRQVGEDSSFVDVARTARQLVVSEAGEMMYATVHPGNTSPRNLNANASYRAVPNDRVPETLRKAA